MFNVGASLVFAETSPDELPAPSADLPVEVDSGADVPPEPDDAKVGDKSQPNARAGEIEAMGFDVKTSKKSTSLRVYLFDDLSRARPKPGRILLLREADSNKMAFRILKNYPGRNQFAAAKIRTYKDEDLPLKKQYHALLKIADLGGVGLDELEKDETDLKDLEGQMGREARRGGKWQLPYVLPYDTELDASTSPPPWDVTADDFGDEDYNEAEYQKLIAVEKLHFDRDRNAVSLFMGTYRAYDSAGDGAYYFAFGARYGLSLARKMVFQSNSVQDSLVLEGSAGLYKIVGFASATDAYSVLAMTAAFRYNLHLNEDWVPFINFGITQNFVLSAYNDTALAFTNQGLASTQPAIGVGLLARLGPKWFLRFDLGFDLLAAGLTLRF